MTPSASDLPEGAFLVRSSAPRGLWWFAPLWLFAAATAVPAAGAVSAFTAAASVLLDVAPQPPPVGMIAGASTVATLLGGGYLIALTLALVVSMVAFASSTHARPAERSIDASGFGGLPWPERGRLLLQGDAERGKVELILDDFGGESVVLRTWSKVRATRLDDGWSLERIRTFAAQVQGLCDLPLIDEAPYEATWRAQEIARDHRRTPGYDVLYDQIDEPPVGQANLDGLEFTVGDTHLTLSATHLKRKRGHALPIPSVWAVVPWYGLMPFRTGSAIHYGMVGELRAITHESSVTLHQIRSPTPADAATLNALAGELHRTVEAARTAWIDRGHEGDVPDALSALVDEPRDPEPFDGDATAEASRRAQARSTRDPQAAARRTTA